MIPKECHRGRRHHHLSRWFFCILTLGFLDSTTNGADSSFSTDYIFSPQFISNGGGLATGSTYLIESTVGDIGDTSASDNFVVYGGYQGQFPEADELQFFALTREGIANATPGVSIDTPVEPITNRVELNAALRPIREGLICDGVTPLMFKVAAPLSAAATTYSISSEGLTGGAIKGGLASHLRVWDQGTWKDASATQFVLTVPPATPNQSENNGFFYISGIASADIQISDQVHAELVRRVTVQQRDVNSNPIGLPMTAEVHLRKPPVVLVHGYNTSGAWSGQFKLSLALERPSEFVREIQYGVDPVTGSTDANTYGSLFDCAKMLDQQLHEAVEDSPNNPLFSRFAYTRYDAVGHSQGGVLLRMLSSRLAIGTTPSFRSKENAFRGRFRRVITIGSPHNGSTFMRYLAQLRKNEKGITRFSPIQRLIQDKFDPWGAGSQISVLNSPGGPWAPDEAAPFYLIRTTIDGGRPPSPSSPLCFKLFGISLQGGNRVLPDGSDGAVDLESQGHLTAIHNVYTFQPAIEIAHAEPNLFFGTITNQAASSDVANKVRQALNDELWSPYEGFGPFPTPSLSTTELRDQIDLEAASWNPIDAPINEIGSNFTSNTSNTLSAGQPIGGANHVFQLSPPQGQAVAGAVTWLAVGYGANGVTTEGIALTVDPGDSKKVTLIVDPAYVGDVVLFATYPLADGTVASVNPVRVLTVGPSSTELVGIELRPGELSLTARQSVDLTLWGSYTDMTKRQLFIDPATTSFSTSDATKAVVSDVGLVTLKEEGSVTIEATMSGKTASCHFNITPADTPVIASTPLPPAVVGEPFMYVASATNAPSSFGANGLPPGVAVFDSQAGVFAGVPTVPGEYEITFTAVNSAGAGIRNATLSVGMPITYWRQQWFGTSSDVGAAADSSDFDHDGLPNVVEYAFGLNPTLGGSNQLPVGQIIGSDYVIGFDEPGGVVGNTYGAEKSADLINWTPIADTGTGKHHVFKVSASGGSNAFLRLKVTR